MKLDPSQVAGTLAKSLASVWLIAGEEPLLIHESADTVRAAARAQGYAEREVLDAEKGFDWSRLVDACNAMSLFASLRIVELRLASAPDAAGAAVLAQLAKAPPREVLLLVLAGKVEWKSRSGGWFAALENAGVAVYAEPLKPEALPRWIEARLGRAGLAIEPDALRLLAERTEGNLLAAQQEIDKLALLHAQGARLAVADIESGVADSAHFEVFGWVDKLLAGDAKAAVRGLEGLRGEGVEPLAILGTLAYALRELAKGASAYARLRDAAAAAQGLRVARPSQPFYARAIERTTQNQALGWLRRCSQIDRLAKSTGGGPAAWEELLTLVLAATRAAPGKMAKAKR